MEFYSSSTLGVVDRAFTEESGAGGGNALTADDVARIVGNALASMRVYVVESDITAAQNSVRAVVEQATF